MQVAKKQKIIRSNAKPTQTNNLLNKPKSLNDADRKHSITGIDNVDQVNAFADLSISKTEENNIALQTKLHNSLSSKKDHDSLFDIKKAVADLSDVKSADEVFKIRTNQVVEIDRDSLSKVVFPVFQDLMKEHRDQIINDLMNKFDLSLLDTDLLEKTLKNTIGQDKWTFLLEEAVKSYMKDQEMYVKTVINNIIHEKIGDVIENELERMIEEVIRKNIDKEKWEDLLYASVENYVRSKEMYVKTVINNVIQDEMASKVKSGLGSVFDTVLKKILRDK